VLDFGMFYFNRDLRLAVADASASRKIPMICSSLNRLPFICPSPFSDGLYL
jgi:hypothetical protein